MLKADFLSEITPVAYRVCADFGLRTSVCIAQAILESGWGVNRIGLYNVFGRKYVDYGDFMEVATQEEVDGEMVDTIALFRVYDSLYAAVVSYCMLLTHEPYEAVKPLYNDLEAYVRAMGDVYASDSRYADKVLELIKEYNLTEFDV